jgi:hypothetical protein
MEISVKRYHETKNFTISKVFIDGVQECYGLEDEHRDVKVMHETRIPAGKYEIKLRKFGGHHIRYKEKFPTEHQGMLWLQDVPNFKDILIHIGNTDADTSGCLLLGEQVDLVKGRILYSTRAYLKFYKKVVKELVEGKKIYITIQ